MLGLSTNCNMYKYYKRAINVLNHSNTRPRKQYHYSM